MLASEIGALGEGVWRDHPQKFVGNSMLPLLSARGDAADESFVDGMAPTPELLRCPYLLQVLSSFGAVLGRTRLMRLAGQAEVSPHVDGSYYWAERVRVHVPIVTQPTVRFVCGGATINMQEGECWIFDTWREHKVYNEANEQRIHLVADTVGGGDFWSLVDHGRPHDASPAGWQARHVVPSASPIAPPLVCERYNFPRIMSPWEMQHHLQGFNGDVVEQQSEVAVQARIACLRLARTWRGLWARYGDSGEGFDAYRAALQAFLDELPHDVERLGLLNGTPWYRAVVAVVLKSAVRD
ncbi:MAG: aspartyl/asparaginyl beta-hydroxylase domain-containing protein [Thermomonas sp.]